MSELVGNISKMKTEYNGDDAVQYYLPVGDSSLPMNAQLGKSLELTFTGSINCISCQRKIKKSFSQGYCYPCFTTLPETDMCIVKPETCHFHRNTCRDSNWGKEHCFIDHTIYLSNSSGLKVGITRTHQQTTRWIDQGAVQAIALGTVKKRLDAGLVEMALKSKVADKTNWRKMLKNDVESIDMVAKAKELLLLVPSEIDFTLNEDLEPLAIKFPVLEFPKTVKSFNLDKDPIVQGALMGIKGQYLIFDKGVINMRKYAGYELKVKTFA